MIEGSPAQQTQGPTPEQKPSQSQTPPGSDPCNEPKPPQPEPPKGEQPCPPEPEQPCPPKPPVDDWDPRCPDPLPDPCKEPPKDQAELPDCGVAPADDPTAQLSNLRTQLEKEQNEIEQLEQKKTSIADLTERIQSLQKVVDALKTVGDGYREFYQTTEVQRKEVECFIPTVRCQLKLSDKETECITRAIAAVQARVDKAVNDYRAQRARVQAHEAAYARAEWRLKDARLIHDFLKTGLQDAVRKRRDDLTKLKALADPKKNRCEVEFLLREMQAIISSERTPPENSISCYPPRDPSFWSGLTLGTYIDCWPSESYEKGYGKAVVRLNQAEYVEKCRKSGLEAARKRLTELEKAAKEATEKRREWILKELKEQRCCGGNGNCA
jgi:chromosome segregation ATPase